MEVYWQDAVGEAIFSPVSLESFPNCRFKVDREGFLKIKPWVTTPHIGALDK